MAIKASGVAVRAEGTGRVLMMRRNEPDHPSHGKLEFPGGTLEPAEGPLQAAVREWQEEAHSQLPPGQLTGSWLSSSGVYQGHVWQVPSESDINLKPGIHDGHIPNPDDPALDSPEVLLWVDPSSVDPAGLREELAKDIDLWQQLVIGTDVPAQNVGTPADMASESVEKQMPRPRAIAEEGRGMPEETDEDRRVRVLARDLADRETAELRETVERLTAENVGLQGQLDVATVARQTAEAARDTAVEQVETTNRAVAEERERASRRETRVASLREAVPNAPEDYLTGETGQARVARIVAMTDEAFTDHLAELRAVASPAATVANPPRETAMQGEPAGSGSDAAGGTAPAASKFFGVITPASSAGKEG